MALLALMAGTVSYVHIHVLVELRGPPTSAAGPTRPWCQGLIVPGSTTLLADSRAGGGWREAALGGACCRQHGEPGRQRRSRPAHSGRAGDRSLAVVRPHQRLRAADAPSAPRCR